MKKYKLLFTEELNQSLFKYLVMIKLIMFLQLSFMSYAFSTVYAQKLSIQKNDISLVSIFKEIKKQTGYRVVCKADILNNRPQLNVSIINKSVKEALDIVLPKDLTYQIDGKSIVVQQREALQAAVSKRTDQAVVNWELSGEVIDQSGQPIVGVSVRDITTEKSTISDSEGKFRIDVQNQSILSISHLGYRPQEVVVGNQSRIRILLESDIDELEEIVIVGFGRQRKESVVGAISSISAKELRVPTSNLSNAFAGRIAGVVSVQRGAEPGADGSNFWIRGISTFAGSSTPLIFIDGVESGSNELNNLAPEVIDNFSVLKDASATALYGARGANGVLLVTTKTGSDLEKARINFRVENTFSSPTQTVELADPIDYMKVFNYAETNRGRVPRFTQEKIESTKSGFDKIAYPSVDWKDVLFKDVALNQYANLNVTGGGKRADYFISATANNDNGILRKDPYNDFDNNIKMRNINLLSNVGVNITNTTRAVVRLNYNLQDYNGSAMGSSDIYYRMFLAPPVLFQPVLPNTNQSDHILFGNVNGGPIPVVGGSNIYYNPYASMVSGYTERSSANTIASLEVNQDLNFLLKGLQAKGILSFKNYSVTSMSRSFVPFYYEVSDYKEIDGVWQNTYRNLSQGTTALDFTTWNWGDKLVNSNLILDWGQKYNKHDVAAMFTVLARNYNVNVSGSFQQSLPRKNLGYSGRVTYAYDSKYFFEGNFGYTGAETFEIGNRFGFFPSLAAGYMISNEEFWHTIKPYINNLKIRGSWGIVGNANIYDESGNEIRFPYLDEVSLNGAGYTFGDNRQTSRFGAIVNKYGASGARWEEGEKYNVGADISLFRKLNITGDYFTEKRSGIFMQRRLIAAESGIVGNNPYANIGVVKNSGFDASMSFQQDINRDFYINLRGTITYSNNELLDRDEPTQQYPYQSQIGHNLGVNFGLIAEGLYKDEDDILNSPVSTYNHDLLPGDIKYKDLNNDNKIDDYDKTYFGNPVTPKLIYGFGASMQYKKLDFSFFFQGASKVTLIMSGIHPFNQDGSSLLKFIADDYYSETNPNAEYPRLITNVHEHNNFQTSTFWARDASFLRLKTAELGYNHKSIRIFLSGQNLLTMSKFKYWDPELGNGRGLQYPNSRVVSIGAQINL